MNIPHVIDSSGWVAITAAGKSGRCFLDVDDDDAAGNVDVRIFHTSGTPNGNDTTNSPRLYKPNSNVQFYEMIPDTPEDVFYIICKDPESNARVIVDENQGTAVIAGKQDVNKQDQFTPGIIQKFNQVHDSTELAEDIVIISHNPVDFVYDIVVVSATGIVVGSHIILFNPVLLRFTTFTALAVNGTTITLDSPVDVPYTAGTFVDIAITDLAVDGSTTPQVFGLRGTGVIPGVEIKVDITRIIVNCLTTNSVDLSKFGDIALGLTRGLVLRFRNGDVFNIFNIKTNGELDNITQDWKPYDAQNVQQGQNGFTVRLTFNGDDKLGIVQRLRAGEDVELIVQDNLLTILSLTVYGEGHIVED